MESLGFDSIWLSDHIVLVEDAASPYPFSEDGRFILPADEDWLEWTVTAAYLAANTSSVEVGVGVCVLPLRHPLLLAKQVATLDQLSGGRIILGVGAGWLAEEFEALGQDFAQRGRAMDAGMALLRESFRDEVAPGTRGPYTIPEGVHVRPTPVRRQVPLLVGGDSAAARRRVVEHGDGWYGTAVGGIMAPEDLREVIADLERRCSRVGRDFADLELALRVAAPRRVVSTREFRQCLVEYVRAGVTRLSFDIGWGAPEQLEARLSDLRDAIGEAVAAA